MMNSDREHWPPMRKWALFLAMLATGTSIMVSVIAGWARGGTVIERLSWSLVGTVVLLSAHLIPALIRDERQLVRAPAFLLWAAAMLATSYGHATFFLSAQQHSGAVRASAITLDTAIAIPPQGRNPVAIAADLARADRDLAWSDSLKCVGECRGLKARRNALHARIEALRVEQEQAKRRDAAVDRLAAAQTWLQARRDRAETDPVTSAVAQLVGYRVGALDLTLALFMGWLLEGVGCLAWLLAIQHDRVRGPSPRLYSEPRTRPEERGELGMSYRSASPVMASKVLATAVEPMPVSTPADPSPYVVGDATNDPAIAHGTTAEPQPDILDTAQTADRSLAMDQLPSSDRTSIPIARSAPGTAVEADLARVTAAISVGEVRPTIDSIRRFLRCKQGHAQEVRRAYITASLESA